MNPSKKSILPQTRRSLLIRLKNKSNDAWAEFLEIYQNTILRFALSKGLQQADAEDVAQEVFEAVEKKIPNWDFSDSAGKFRHWLFSVARNIAVDRFKDQFKNLEVTIENIEPSSISSDHQSGPTETLFRLELRRALFHWAAEKIQPEFKKSSWDSFRLVALEGIKPEEASKILDISIGSIYASKARILSKLKKTIATIDEQAFDFDLENLSQTS